MTTDTTLATRRKDCPFYGWTHTLPMGFMANSRGNQCAIITDAFAPCQMEIGGEDPSWKRCYLGQRPDVKKYLEENASQITVQHEDRKPQTLDEWIRGFLE